MRGSSGIFRARFGEAQLGTTWLVLHSAFVRARAGGSEVASRTSCGMMAAATRMTDSQVIASRSPALAGSKARSKVGKFCERQLVVMPQVVEQLAHSRRHLMVYPQLLG